MGHGFVQPRQLLEGNAQIVVGFRIGWTNAQGLLVMLDSFLPLAAVGQANCKIIVSFQVTTRQGECLAKFCFGIFLQALG